MAEPLDDLSAMLEAPLLLGADAAAHEQPWRGAPGSALAVARPVGIEEVQAVVAWCREHSVRLLAQGAVTGLVGASTPPPEGPAPLVLSTDALKHRLEIEPAGATAVVSAGVRLSELNSEAARHGLELAVDLAADPALGAMVATNTGGSRVLRHGDMASSILGVQAVIADDHQSVIGQVQSLRKNNTGPDATRLLIGSAGAFGVITAVAMKLSPLPRRRVTALVGPLADDAAVELLVVLRAELGDRLSAFEVMCASAIEAAVGHMPNPPPVNPGTDLQVTVLVEASGEDDVDEALLDAVSRAGGDFASGSLSVPPSTAWTMRHAITDGLRRRGEVIGFDLSVHPIDLPSLRAGARQLVTNLRSDLVVADFGHWGDGGMHCNVVVPIGSPMDASDKAELRSAMYDLVQRLGGSFSAEHGIGPTNAQRWLDSTPESTRAVLAAFKAAVDPLGILGHPGLPF